MVDSVFSSDDIAFSFDRCSLFRTITPTTTRPITHTTETMTGTAVELASSGVEMFVSVASWLNPNQLYHFFFLVVVVDVFVVDVCTVYKCG